MSDDQDEADQDRVPQNFRHHAVRVLAQPHYLQRDVQLRKQLRPSHKRVFVGSILWINEEFKLLDRVKLRCGPFADSTLHVQSEALTHGQYNNTL